MKKLLSILVAICMIMQVLPVFAEDVATEAADTYGFIINDTFDDGTAQGWTAGECGSGSAALTPTTLETGENVLKVDLGVSANGIGWATLYESNIYKDIEGLDFTGDNLVKIKARVKDASPFMIKVNRPNGAGWGSGLELKASDNNHYTVAGFNSGKPVYGSGIAGNDPAFKGVTTFTKKADGTEFDYTNVDLTDTWVDYTVIINGATNEQSVTASFEYNGETVTLVSGSDSTFIQPSAVYTGAGLTENVFPSFDRLTFASKDYSAASTLYIDSVSVENIEIVSAGGQNLTGKTIAPGESFKLQLVTDSQIAEVPDDVLTVSNVTGTQTYNAAEKTIYFTPDYDLTAGTTYTLEVNTSDLAAAGINYTGDTSFSVKAISKRFTTTGYVFNDDFNDGTAQGWAAGDCGSGSAALTPTTLETGENVLKVDLGVSANGIGWATLYESNIYKDIEGLDFTGDNLVKIKARVKDASNFMIKVNRPNGAGWGSGLALKASDNNHYTVAGFNSGKPLYGERVAGNDPAFKGVTTFTKKADGTEFDYTNVDLTDTWVDYTVIINGATNEQSVTASFEYNGETVTLVSGSDSTFIQPSAVYTGAGLTGTTFTSFDRLTFASKDYSAASTLYIDSVSVENIVEADISFEYTGDSVVNNGDELTFAVTTDADTVPENIVKINGITAQATYDSVNKVLTVIAGNINGISNTIEIDVDVLADNGFTVTGETTFSVSGLGYVFNDTFDDGTTQGWAAGECGSGSATLTPTTLETGENVLKVDLGVSANGIGWATLYESNIYKDIEGLDFTGDNLVKIKARVKDASPFMIKVNRPNGAGWGSGLALKASDNNHYTVAGFNSGKPVYGSGIATNDSTFKGVTTFTKKADGTEFDYTNVDLTDTWVDYTVIINGATNSQTVTASFEYNGETVTLVSGSDSTFIQPSAVYTGAGLTENVFPSFDRLTFASKDYSAASTLYIDSVSVETFVPSDISFEYTGNGVVNNGDELTFKVTTDADTIPENIVSINGVTAQATYDSANKVLTVIAENIKGANNTISILTGILTGNGLNATGETTFSVAGLGYVFKDTFDDSTAQGWAAGDCGSGSATLTPTTLETGEKVLKVELGASGEGTQWINLYESNLYKDVEGLSFTGDNLVKIKARVKNASPFMIKVNRPNGAGWGSGLALNAPNANHYAVAGFNSGKPVYGGAIAGNDTNHKGIKTFANKADGTEFDYTNVDLTDTWVDYTIIINGATNSQTVTASFEYNGETVTLVSGSDSTFIQPSAVYTGAGLTGTTFTSFDRLTFASRDFSAASILYIDSVSVENILPQKISAEYISDALIDPTGSILIKLDGDITSVPDGAATVEGTPVTQSFNPETKTLTLTPVTAFDGGKNLNVVINNSVFAANGFVVEGETSFKFTTTGFAFSDTFDDGTAQGWTAGDCGSGSATVTPTTLETGEKVLMAELGASGDGTQWTTLYESNLFKEAVGGIDFTGNNNIRIKARIKNASPYLIKVNRPNGSGWGSGLPILSSNYNYYMVAGYDEGKPVYGGALDTAKTTNDWKGPESFMYNSDGKLFDYTNVDLSDKWIEYTIVINGATNEQTVTATFEHNGETITLLSGEDSTFLQPDGVYSGSGYENGKCTVFERLTIASKDFAAASTLYIDSISVENIRISETPETTIVYLVNDTAGNSFKNGDVVKPQFTLNAKGIEKSYTVISALYVDGKLDETHVNYVKTEGITTFTDEIGYNVSADDISKLEFKAFVWAGGDGLTTLKPVSGTVVLNPDVTVTDDGLTVYVQAYSGSDVTGTGAISAPVATLEKALEVVKAKKADGYTDGAKILLGEGIYETTETIAVRSENVPAGGLVISSCDGEKAVFTAGTSFNVSDAVKVDDTAILSRLHSDAAKENLYVLDLTEKIALSDIEAVNYPGTYNLNSMLSSTGLETPSSYETLVSFDNELMQVSRYPNSGYATMGTVADAGIVARYMLPEYDGTENDLNVTQENLLKGFEFKSDYENLASWANADQALMFGYFMYDWATQTVPLKEVNVANSTIRSKYPSYYGATEGGRYYVYNLLEEIDLEKEYFLDRNEGKLYFYMPTDANENSTITVGNKYVNLLTVSGASNVTIDLVDFTMTKGVAVVVRGGSSNVVVSNCEISNTASGAVDVTGANNIVENCYIHDVNGGITLNSTNNATAVSTMTASNNKAINNEIENFSIVNKTYTPAITLYGAGNQALNNELHNSEHMAIRYSGYGHLIKENEIYNVCKEVDDSGAIYVGRTWTNRGTQIVNNYFHDINSTINSNNTVAGIFLDDHFAGAYVEGNVFANIGGDGIRGNGGREHTITNNIFVNCAQRSVYMPDNNYTDATASTTYATQISGAEDFIGNSLWEEKYPLMFTTDDNGETVINITEMKEPASHTFTNNLCVKAPFYYGERVTEKATDVTTGNYSTQTDPGFKDMNGGDFSIEESVVKALIPQFKAIDFSRIGRY